MDQHLPHVHWRRARWATVVTFVIATCVVPAQLNGAVAETTYPNWCSGTLRPSDTWNTLTVDLTVKRQHVTSAGEIIGAPSPTASYRLERSSRTGTWKTKISVLAVDRPPMYALTGAVRARTPFPVGWIEDDEDGTPLRAYGPNGALLQTIPTNSGSTLVRTIGQQWLDAFVATPGKKTARQQSFERLFGKPTRVGTLSRYFRPVTDGSQEVMVEPKTVVPVESNAVKSGKLVGHRTFTYGPAPDSAVVRTAVHAETVTSMDTGERTIVDTGFSRICLERR